MERTHICGGCGSREDVGYLVDATIAALQARVQELEQWVQDQSTANLETMRHMDETQSRAMDAGAQLTQRTAELEAAKADFVDASTDRDDWITSWRVLQRHNERIEAELERVRAVSNPCSKIFTHKWLDPECVENGCQSLKLKHRQGMEG